MATIRKRTGKRGTTYDCLVRVSGSKHFGRSFKDRETAELWGLYKENLIAEMRNFAPRWQDMYTLKTVVMLKYENSSRERDTILNAFDKFMDRPIGSITYEEYKKHAEDMLNEKVRKGGCARTGTGIIKKQSLGTVIRKFAYLSSAVNHAIANGVQVENHPIKIVAWLRTMKKEQQN